MTSALKAAVIGASGIGKHHAKWLDRLDCDVVAFAGSNAESVRDTADMLEDSFGITARGYTDVGELLEKKKPDAVNICSPPDLHYEHFMAAATAGCHILCEKPLTWDENKSPDTLLDEARQMAQAGPDDAVRAVNTQYVAGREPYLKLCRQIGSEPGPAESFFMQIDSRHTNKVYERVWIDLASHPLSVMLGFCGGGEIIPGSEELLVQREQATAHFDFQPVEGPVCECEIVVRAWRTEGDLVRRFGINDCLVDYEGRNDENGVYAAFLSAGDTEIRADDFMYQSIRQFLDTIRGGADEPLAPIGDGYLNEQMQFAILDAARRV
ncbi:MAG: Gfo/Idh/MocA family oxidoreductase [Armatimonadota bacterium]